LGIPTRQSATAQQGHTVGIWLLILLFSLMGLIASTKAAVVAQLSLVPALADITVVARDHLTGSKLTESLSKAAGLAVVVDIVQGDMEDNKRALPNPSFESMVSVTLWSNPLLLMYDETSQTAASAPFDSTQRNPDDVLEAILKSLHNLAFSVDVDGECCSRNALKLRGWQPISTATNMHVIEIMCQTTLHLT
jgi:hypothetical protein